MSAGPKPLTIEEYKKRQKRSEQEHIKIPQVTKPKRRGGFTNKLKREKSILLREVNSNPPPTWERSSNIWNRINNIDRIIETFKKHKNIKIC